jgi:hypothetical protein
MPKDMAVDGTGKPLPYTPDQVQAIVHQALADGQILAAIVRKGDDLMVQVFGPPSQEILDVLLETVRAYRVVLRGQG